MSVWNTTFASPKILFGSCPFLPTPESESPGLPLPPYPLPIVSIQLIAIVGESGIVAIWNPSGSNKFVPDLILFALLIGELGVSKTASIHKLSIL